ncbi:MAG: type II secretion system F family protein [Paracoccaceae bacterium]
MQSLLIQHRDTIIAISAALCVILIVLGLAWPLLRGNRLDKRIWQITHVDERARQLARSGEGTAVVHSLMRKEPRKVLLDIVRRFDLVRLAEDADTILLLQRAGYRGRSPVITYLALRVILPLVMLLLSAFYVFAIIKPDLPLWVLAAMVTVSSIGGFYVPTIFLRNRTTKRQMSIRRAWPNALDLLLICVESGMSSEASFRKVTQEIGSDSRALAEELSLTTAELAFLPERRAAYENLAMRTDVDSVKSAIVSLIQSEKHGTSLGQALRVLSREGRETRMADAEQMAAALPPKLTVPMIVFFLPVLFAVILAPMIIQMMQD